MDEKVDGTRLSGVPETTLWTLHNRASEAARPDALIHDPWAVHLRGNIDHPYERAFGKPSQSHPLRALRFDHAMREFLAEHPGATVVCLGEGLETGFWRIADAGVRWVSVDLPEIIALRQQLLPTEPQVCNIALSALDRSWMDAVEPDADVLISAQGLLMSPPADVFALITDCARRFPGIQMIFDTIPPWLSRRTLRGWRLSPTYTTPPMPFGITVPQAWWCWIRRAKEPDAPSSISSRNALQSGWCTWRAIRLRWPATSRPSPSEATR